MATPSATPCATPTVHPCIATRGVGVADLRGMKLRLRRAAAARAKAELQERQPASQRSIPHLKTGPEPCLHFLPLAGTAASEMQGANERAGPPPTLQK